MSQKICVYAICKNELKFIDKWLENMSEADYIVVLDTGSTDGTFEKLQQDPRVTRVEQEVITPWRFDVARNRSMDLIPDDADILVCTDFDELFEPGWGQYLRDNWIPGYHNRCHYKYAWTHTEIGEPRYIFTYDKIHTREMHWKYPVHEVLAAKNENYEENVLNALDTIYLHHWQDADKSRSNYLPLLQLAAEENPDDSHIWSLLGREYLIAHDFDNAINVFLDTLDKPDIETSSLGCVLLQTLNLLAVAYYEIQDYDSAIWYCNTFIRVNNSYREPYLLLARIFMQQEAWTMAEASVLAAIKYGTYKQNWVESTYSWNSDVPELLADIYIKLEQYDLALANIKEALGYKPDNVNLLKLYIYCLEQKQ